MFAKVVQGEGGEEGALVSRSSSSHPKEILLSALIRMSEQMPFYVVTAFVLTYLTDTKPLQQQLRPHRDAGRGRDRVVLPVFGHLSDVVGRKRVYMTGAAIMGVWGFVYFAMLDSGVPGWSSWRWPSGSSRTPSVRPAGGADRGELPDGAALRRRGSGYQLASVVAGGPAALVATYLIHRSARVRRGGLHRGRGRDHAGACAALKDYSRSDITDDARRRTPVRRRAPLRRGR